MKQQYNTIFTLAGIIFLIYSCHQASEELPEIFEAEVDEVVDILAENFLTVNIIGGEGDQAFSSGRFVGGEDSYLNNASQDHEKDLIPLIVCLKNLDLGQSQLQDFRRQLFVFDNCKSYSMESYKEEIRKLIVNIESSRLDLLENFRSGAISREDFEMQVEELRKSYSVLMEELKESYKEDLIPCLKGFISRMQIELGREDWLKFRKCVSEI